MRPVVKKRLLLAAAASGGLLAFVGYPAVKNVYPIRRQTTVTDDYVDIPTATADLTKDIILPETIGAGTDVSIDISHWLLLSMLKSKNQARRERALAQLASQRRWNDAECQEIAQALDKQDIIRLARTVDADVRLFLAPPSINVVEKTLGSSRLDKHVKSILKELSENNNSCSSCANFYTNLSIRVRPDSSLLANHDLNQVDKVMHLESRKRKKLGYSGDVVKLKAVLSNILCSEEQAISMTKSGLLIALLYFHYKYSKDLQVKSLLSQIVSALSVYESTRDLIITNGWVRILVEYTRSDFLELSLPAFKALANLDKESTSSYGIYGSHLYLLSPFYRRQDSEPRPDFDVVFVHGLVGSVFKSWRQGSIVLGAADGQAISGQPSDDTPITELLPGLIEPTFDETSLRDRMAAGGIISNDSPPYTGCWPKDWLAKDLPSLRVLALDYPTALSSWRTDCDSSKDTLRQRSIHVIQQLEAAKLGDRPIVWVAHSMGGLLVKQILVMCDELRNKQAGADSSPPTSEQLFAKQLLKQTKGIAFYSVPHKGSNLDWIERKNLQKLLALTTEVIELQKGSPLLLELHEKFLKLMRSDECANVRFLSFAESAISCFGVNKVVQWRGVLVHEDSLKFEMGPVYQLNIDHAHTCKPHDKDAITYVKTLNLIRSLMPREKQTDEERLMSFISFIPV